MNEDRCDIHDVSRAASDLVALCCSTGAMRLNDNFYQLTFSELVSTFANEIIQAVNEGAISAKQGLQEIKDEYSRIANHSAFYVSNGLGVTAGALQFESGFSKMRSSRGLASPIGIPLMAHGFNNIYEGLGNIYNGPGKTAVLGPIREAYQFALNDEANGNRAYYSTDLALSAYNLVALTRKPNSVQLFNRDPINYEPTYRQMSSPSLIFEALVDAITLRNLSDQIAPSN